MKRNSELLKLVKAVELWFNCDEEENACILYKYRNGYESPEARAIRRMDIALKKAKKKLRLK